MRRSIFDFQDETLLFKAALPIKTMVGFGMVLGAVPSLLLSAAAAAASRSRQTRLGATATHSNNNDNSCTAIVLSSVVPLVLGSLMVFQGTLYNLLYKMMTGTSRDPLTRRVERGRKCAIRPEGQQDFVVFLIGSRAHNQMDSFYKWMGDAMGAMLQELEDHPECGCFGSERFEGVTGGIIVQYWTSLEALNAYARNTMNQHAHPWTKLMAKGRECPDYGFWHEAYEVKDGKYDCIYVNMPPVLLGNALGTRLVDAKGKYVSAAGRAGNTDGSDYPRQLGKPNY